MDLFKNQGFDYCTKSGLTVSLDDMVPLKGREDLYKQTQAKVDELDEAYDQGFLTDTERHQAVVDTWNFLTTKKGPMRKLLKDRRAQSPRNPRFRMMESGARGSTNNYRQLIGRKGLPQKANGDAIEVPITSCFSEGFSVSEYFSSTHGTRKNGSDTALKTADSGYLTRRLVDVAHSVVIREEDCHCDHGRIVEEIKSEDGTLIASFYDRLVGRFPRHDVINPETGELIASKDECMDEETAKKIVNAGFKSLEIRSVLTCEAKEGICVKCYGRNLATGKLATIGDTVGIMAAQSIGEPGTQLTLKNFHNGGIAGQQDITTGLPTKDLALITNIAGVVTKVEAVGSRSQFTVKNDLEEQTYLSYPGATKIVAEGDKVVAGQPLTKGYIDTKDLLACADLATVRKYIISEVKKVYKKDGGSDISDKHLEIIVRQRTNRLSIINPGDCKGLLPGQKVTDVDFTNANEAVLAHAGNPAVGHPIILGITKAALEAESFLSAASFQQTTAVLTDAAIKGKVDYLRGLKENVMIGKLIPAGTGITPLIPVDEDGNDLPEEAPHIDDEESYPLNQDHKE